MKQREEVKIVARFLDGRVVKGTSLNFSPTRRLFSLNVVGGSPDDEPLSISLAQLKAVFFVRDFGGNAQYNDRKEFKSGRSVAPSQSPSQMVM